SKRDWSSDVCSSDLEVQMTTQKDMGGILGPFDAWLLIRGLKTLPLRMDRHSDNAEKIFEKLNHHPMIKSVYYPGDTSHPDYPIMRSEEHTSELQSRFDLVCR